MTTRFLRFWMVLVDSAYELAGEGCDQDESSESGSATSPEASFKLIWIPHFVSGFQKKAEC
jgi:hypothetical protein